MLKVQDFECAGMVLGYPYCERNANENDSNVYYIRIYNVVYDNKKWGVWGLEKALSLQ